VTKYELFRILDWRDKERAEVLRLLREAQRISLEAHAVKP